MITTNSFPNEVTNSPNDDINRNSLTKEDLEGSVKNNVTTTQIESVNGGNCQYIKF